MAKNRHQANGRSTDSATTEASDCRFGVRLVRENCRSLPLVAAVGWALAAQSQVSAQDVDLAILGDQGFVIEGVANFDRAGSSVSGVGDANGDGLADIVVGSPEADPLRLYDAGAAYLVFGKPDRFGVRLTNFGSGPPRTFGVAEGDGLGISVSGAGDVNGDGIPDIIVGAPRAGPLADSSNGASYVLFGRPPEEITTGLGFAGPGGNGFIIRGAGVGDYSGRSVSGAGDVNGDGLADVIIGAWNANTNSGRAGASYIVFGKTDTETVDLQDLGSGGITILGATSGDTVGLSVSGAGDVNGDGLADVVIGAPGRDISDSQNGAGAAYVVFGIRGTTTISLAALGSRGFEIEGDQAFSFAGGSVSGAGDVNGDGLADVIIGAQNYDDFFDDNAGISYVVFGKSDTATVELWTFFLEGFAVVGADEGDRVGSSVSGAGDINGDGLADLLIGATGVGSESGASYVVFGKTTSAPVEIDNLGSQGIVIEGARSMDQSGASVSSAGDVNGDGLADVVIGASTASPDNNYSAGSAFVVFSEVFSESSASYRGFARNGDAPRVAVGVIGDGSNDDSPDSRVWIDFENGSLFGDAASLHEVLINRDDGSFDDAAVDVHWRVQTNRGGWSEAELTFRYTDAELGGADESALMMVHAPSPTGPFSKLPSVVNPDNNTISTVVDELGYFYITEVQGEIRVEGNDTVIETGDTSPQVADHTDFGEVAIGGVTASRRYIIFNEGPGTLSLTGDIIVVGAGFSVAQPFNNAMPPGSGRVFEVRFDATTQGAFNGLVSIPNTDDDENPFTFAVRAEGVELVDLVFSNGFE